MAQKENKVNWQPDEKRPFINPYSFVSFTKRVTRAPVSRGELSGKISCRLKVKDMLSVPDIAENKDPDSRQFDFYSVGDKPTIPGSELRGCIRSAFEAITESCFSVVNSDILSQRDEPEKENISTPGILKREQGKWLIYSADLEKKAKYKDTCDIKRVWLDLSEKPKVKHTYVTAHRDNANEWEAWKAEASDNDIEGFIANLNIYLDNLTDKMKDETDEKILGNIETLEKVIEEEIRLLKEMKNSEDSDYMIPVFFKANGKSLTYFSPAQIGRTVFKNRVPKLLGDHNSCGGENGYCPACSLFGTLGNKLPLASRLRFSDAEAMQNVQISNEYIVLPELSSPKLSAIEFYSEKKPANAQSPKKKDVVRWDYDTKSVKLNGRKFYFHGLPKSGGELGKRQIAVKTALGGSIFGFDVFFDGISETELKKLIWTLTLGQNDIDGNLMYKLGTGKPVGYGSVKIAVDNIYFRNVGFTDEGVAYSISSKSCSEYMSGFNAEQNFDVKALNDLLTVSNYNLIIDESEKPKEKIPVAYPLAERMKTEKNKDSKNREAGHQWFSSNRTAAEKNKAIKIYRDVLPSLSDDADSLKLYVRVEGGGTEQTEANNEQKKNNKKAPPKKNKAKKKR